MKHLGLIAFLLLVGCGSAPLSRDKLAVGNAADLPAEKRAVLYGAITFFYGDTHIAAIDGVQFEAPLAEVELPPGEHTVTGNWSDIAVWFPVVIPLGFECQGISFVAEPGHRYSLRATCLSLPTKFYIKDKDTGQETTPVSCEYK